MAVLSTVIPAFLFWAGIRPIGPRHAPLFGFSGPISTIFLAWIFLGEPLTAAGIAGTVLVLAGRLQLRAADAD
ncbi:MAG: EamA family transporter [Acidiferrobacterales bacterium]